MPRRRNAVDAFRHAARFRDFGGYFCARQDAAVTRLGALRQLHLDHFHLWILGVFRKTFFRKRTVGIAAAEIPRAQFPTDVATHFAVGARERTFARVMVKAAAPRALVE